MVLGLRWSHGKRIGAGLVLAVQQLASCTRDMEAAASLAAAVAIDVVGPAGHKAEELAKAADQIAPDIGLDLEALDDRRRIVRRGATFASGELSSRPVEQLQVCSQRHCQKSFVTGAIGCRARPRAQFVL